MEEKYYYVIKVGNQYLGTTYDGYRCALRKELSQADKFYFKHQVETNLGYIEDSYKGKKRKIMKVAYYEVGEVEIEDVQES